MFLVKRKGLLDCAVAQDIAMSQVLCYDAGAGLVFLWDIAILMLFVASLGA